MDTTEATRKKAAEFAVNQAQKPMTLFHGGAVYPFDPRQAYPHVPMQDPSLQHMGIVNPFIANFLNQSLPSVPIPDAEVPVASPTTMAALAPQGFAISPILQMAMGTARYQQEKQAHRRQQAIENYNVAIKRKALEDELNKRKALAAASMQWFNSLSDSDRRLLEQIYGGDITGLLQTGQITPEAFMDMKRRLYLMRVEEGKKKEQIRKNLQILKGTLGAELLGEDKLKQLEDTSPEVAKLYIDTITNMNKQFIGSFVVDGDKAYQVDSFGKLVPVSPRLVELAKKKGKAKVYSMDELRRGVGKITQTTDLLVSMVSENKFVPASDALRLIKDPQFRSELFKAVHDNMVRLGVQEDVANATAAYLVDAMEQEIATKAEEDPNVMVNLKLLMNHILSARWGEVMTGRGEFLGVPDGKGGVITLPFTQARRFLIKNLYNDVFGEPVWIAIRNEIAPSMGPEEIKQRLMKDDSFARMAVRALQSRWSMKQYDQGIWGRFIDWMHGGLQGIYDRLFGDDTTYSAPAPERFPDYKEPFRKEQ